MKERIKKNIRALREFISRLSGFLIPSLIVVSLALALAIYSIHSSKQLTDSAEKSIVPLFDFSFTDLTLVFLAIYAVLKKPWRENLAGHFKKAYRVQLKSIQKYVKERDALREEVNTLSIFHRTYSSLEEVEKAMREEDGFPSVGDMGKRLWDGNKESLLKGLEDIEHIKNSTDAGKILSNFSQMEYISQDLFQEVRRLRELKSLSKTGTITGDVLFTEEFAKDFPKQSRLQGTVRFKPEYIRDGYISQFWLSWNLFYPNDPDTGKKAKKRDLSKADDWWLLSMSSPYWKYVAFVDFNFEKYTVIHRDGRRVNMPPKDYQLPDGTKLSEWKNRMFRPLKFERDGEA